MFCSSGNCRRYTALIAGSIVGGSVAIILCLLGLFLCIRRCKNRPSKSNAIFVHDSNASNITHGNLFQSGIWSSRYLHDGIWHGPHSISLSFDGQLFEVTGSGSDELGTFTVTGPYSNKTARMGLMQVYRTNHLERQIILQVIWNPQTRQFEGKRYVRCKTHREETQFELKFNRSARV